MPCMWKESLSGHLSLQEDDCLRRQKVDDIALFQSFYEEVSGKTPSEETEQLFKEVLADLMDNEREGGTIA